MIYVSTACLHNTYLKDILKKYAQMGIKRIELSGGTQYYPHIEEDLRCYQKEYNFDYVCHAYFPPHEQNFVVNLASCNNKIYQNSMKHYENCINLLKRINCSVLSVHAGFLIDIQPNEIGKTLSRRDANNERQAIDQFCKAYSILSKKCKDSGIKLYLENNVLSAKNYQIFGGKNNFMLTDYDSFVRLYRNLEFELLLDLGHLFVTTKTLKLDYEDQCEKLRPFTRWIHLSHNNGIEDQHKPLTQGSEILEIFKKKFRGSLPITLETTGDIQDILTCKQMVEKLCQ